MIFDLLSTLINYYRTRNKRPLELLEDLYKPYYPRIIIAAKKQDEPGQPAHLKYGEVYTTSFAEVLQLLKPKKTDRFCDLGSGSGKAVISALMTSPIAVADGYDLNPELIEISNAVAKKCTIAFPELQNKQALFHCQDFTLLENLSDYQIVYVAATCFWGDHWERLNQLLETLPEHAAVIITSRELHNKHFTKINEAKLGMSWGLATVWIYLRL